MRTVSVEEQHRIEALIRTCPLCYVGMADENGIPYVLPMNFGYEDEIVYLHSAPEGHSISILEKIPMCASPSALIPNWCGSMKRWPAATECVPIV